MKLTTPHLGNLHELLGDLFSRLEVDYQPPPPITEKTISLGVAHSPEFACLPLKVTVGNFIEALDNGADTLLMVGGIGPCRFGYYGEIQKRALKEAGYEDFTFITLEPPGVGWRCFISTIKGLAPNHSHYKVFQHIRVCFNKAIMIDYMEAKAFKVRAYEVNRGDTDKALREATRTIQAVSRAKNLLLAKEKGFQILDQVEQDKDHKPLKIAIIGEFYLVLEPFFKFGIEKWLGERGVVVEQSIYLTDWIRPSGKNPVVGISNKDIAKAAEPYLKHAVGGDGLASIGHAVEYAKEGFDGVIHLLPFTCMPDTIAKAMLTKVSDHHDIPVLSLVIDELTGKAGVMTRIEAFLDLVKSRRQQKTRGDQWMDISVSMSDQ